MNYTGEREKIAMKDAFAATLEELMQNDENVVYFDADLMNSMGTLKLTKQFPARAIDCGVQEANMIGVAAGISALGFKPVAHTFGPFASRRCFDQAFMSGAYAKNSVVIVGSDAGVTAAYNGGTHMPFEDVAMYRAMPESAIFDMVDSTMLKEVLKFAVERRGVTYIRTPRKNCVGVYAPGSAFEMGKANVLKDGADVAIIACGIMVPIALDAAKRLKEQGVDAAVIDVVSIKPLDTATVAEYAEKCGAVVTAENVNINGSMGAAVCEALAAIKPVPVLRVGVEDKFGEVGDEEYLKKRFGLTPENIIEKALAAMKLKGK